jgi:hypothetical protein
MNHRAVLLVLCLAPTIAAQSVIVPASAANTRGPSGLNTLVRDAGQPRTYMLGINASELAGIPLGSLINGVSFRSYVGTGSLASWPTADVTWTNYDISVGPAIPTASMTGAFQANFSSPPVVVRTGPMVVTAATPWLNNATLPAPQPNPFGEFYFDFQVPYLYLGGDLAILFTHSGSNQTASFVFLDYVTTSGNVPGVAFTQSVYQGTAGTVTTSFFIQRIHFGHGTGCPGAGGMVPNLVQSQNTTGGLGGPIVMALANAPVATAGIYAFGFVPVTLPMPNGCNLWLVPVASNLVILDNHGRGNLTINVPPAVTGGFDAQAVVLDPLGPGGYTASNAISPRAF